MRVSVLSICATALCATAAAASGITGVWQTEPDRKDLVSHIEIAPCGSGFCGKVLRVYNQAGDRVQTPNVGRRLFWDVSQQADGSYGGGTAYVPLINGETRNFTMNLKGDTLRVKGRIGPVSATQNWQRLQ